MSRSFFALTLASFATTALLLYVESVATIA